MILVIGLHIGMTTWTAIFIFDLHFMVQQLCKFALSPHSFKRNSCYVFSINNCIVNSHQKCFAELLQIRIFYFSNSFP